MKAVEGIASFASIQREEGGSSRKGLLCCCLGALRRKGKKEPLGSLMKEVILSWEGG